MNAAPSHLPDPPPRRPNSGGPSSVPKCIHSAVVLGAVNVSWLEGHAVGELISKRRAYKRKNLDGEICFPQGVIAYTHESAVPAIARGTHSDMDNSGKRPNNNIKDCSLRDQLRQCKIFLFFIVLVCHVACGQALFSLLGLVLAKNSDWTSVELCPH